LITYANKHLSASLVTVFWPLQVPVAVILASCGVGIFHQTAPGPICETLNSHEVMGGLLIIVGLLACTFSDYMERQEKGSVTHKADFGSSINGPLLHTKVSYHPPRYRSLGVVASVPILAGIPSRCAAEAVLSVSVRA
jgi:hypothetical protein